MSTNNNRRLLHRKEWQLMTPAPVSAGSGCVYIGDDSARNRFTLHIQGTTLHYLYDHEEDAWIQLPSGGFAGTFGAGTTGQYFPWSIDLRANGGTTTTITTAAASYNLTRFIKGCTLEFLTGSNAGRTVTITDMINDGTTCTIYLDSATPFATANSDFFRINSGRFFVLSPYTSLSAGVFKSFDIATMAWSGNLATTNLPASWGTDGAMTTPYQFNNPFVSGTASAGGLNTLTDSTQTWAASNFPNYQVKIIGATGIGQVRRISNNTSTQLTVTSNWTTQPVNGSKYIIEAAEDLYLAGNGSTLFYRYTIPNQLAGTTEAWTAMTSAGSTIGIGGTLDAIVGATESTWTNRNNLLNGRYIYSFRGTGTSTLQRYDIPTNTWIADGAGGVANYGPVQEILQTGSCAIAFAGRIYIRKDGTNRFFYYDIVANDMVPFTTNLYTDSTAVVGQKIWIKKYDDQTMWLYSIRNQDVILHRVMMF